MNARRALLRRLQLLTVTVFIGSSATGCGSISLQEVPAPGESFSDGYDLTVEFASVLNLPDRAKVVMDGVKVGVVTEVEVEDARVDVGVRIDPRVEIPSTVRAVLQQDTVLGDIYIAFNRDEENQAASPFGPHATVPIAQTTSPAQLEDTLAVIANFVTSGSIQRIQNSITKMNVVTPSESGAVSNLAAQTAADLAELSNNIDDVDRWFAGLADTTEVLSSRTATLEYFLSPGGMVAWDRTTLTLSYIGTILPSVGSIYNGGFWLVPMLRSLQRATGAVKGAGIDLLTDGPAWQRLLVDDVVPFLRDPTVNITSIDGAGGNGDLKGQVINILRILGGLR